MRMSRSKKTNPISAYVRTPWTNLSAKVRGERVDDDEAGKLKLDFSRLAKAGFITPETIELDVARDFSIVKRRLFRRLCFFGPEHDQSAEGAKRRCPIVLVTSGNPGEGKTFSSINFALSLAIEEQLNILLIDTDLAKPSVTNVIGFPYRKRGLFDCLNDPSLALEDVILTFEQLSLSVMPGGEAKTAPSSLLGGKAMADVIRRIRDLNRYDMLVFDGPPLLATTEAAVLAPHADEVVLVIGAGDATSTQLDASLDLLDVSSDKISLLLNRAVISERRSGYYGHDYRPDQVPA
ncbi:MAG: tyrosine-protein kinase family protein [Geminicoccaceae bacterium]